MFLTWDVSGFKGSSKKKKEGGEWGEHTYFFLCCFWSLLGNVPCATCRPETARASPVTNAITPTQQRSYREFCAGLDCSALQLAQRSSVAEAEVTWHKYLTCTRKEERAERHLTHEGQAYL